MARTFPETTTMTTWVEALLHADVPPPTPATWLAAIALDEVRHTPEDLLIGTTVMTSPIPSLRVAIETLVEAVFGADAIAPGDPVPKGGLMLLPDSRSYPGWVADQSAAGASALVIDVSATSVQPSSAMVMAENTFEVVDLFGADAVMDLVHLVTGGRLDLPSNMPVIGYLDLLGVVVAGSTCEACEARLSKLVEAKREAAARARELAETDARPLGQVAAGVVRKLSEMTGFGDAGKWGLQLAADLRAYDDGKLPWSEVDRGVLLSGPPGSGKTTFAKALALEAGVELVPTTYADWHGSGSGDSVAKGLTKLFAVWRAKAEKASIILLVDEIDSMGVRGANGNNDSWWGAIINTWLAFLDGAVPREGIVVIGCTNHAGNVDPALVRPGRLDRHVELPYPGIEAMAGIVRFHLGPAAVSDEAELARAARACRGMSPAQVEQLCREARRTARTMFKRAVHADDVSLVIGARRLADLQRPGAREVDHRVAIHEAAHAIAMLGSSSDTLMHVDLDAAMTLSSGRTLLTLADVEARLVVLLAGMAAEQILFGGHASGVSADLREATTIATSAQATWGMGVLGLRVMPGDAALVDATVTAAVDAILVAAHTRARAMVEASSEAIERLAGELQARRYLDADEVRAVVQDVVPPRPRTGADDRLGRTNGRRP